MTPKTEIASPDTEINDGDRSDMTINRISDTTS